MTERITETAEHSSRPRRYTPGQKVVVDGTITLEFLRYVGTTEAEVSLGAAGSYVVKLTHITAL